MARQALAAYSFCDQDRCLPRSRQVRCCGVFTEYPDACCVLRVGKVVDTGKENIPEQACKQQYRNSISDLLPMIMHLHVGQGPGDEQGNGWDRKGGQSRNATGYFSAKHKQEG